MRRSHLQPGRRPKAFKPAPHTQRFRALKLEARYAETSAMVREAFADKIDEDASEAAAEAAEMLDAMLDQMAAEVVAEWDDTTFAPWLRWAA